MLLWPVAVVLVLVVVIAECKMRMSTGEDTVENLNDALRNYLDLSATGGSGIVSDPPDP